MKSTRILVVVMAVMFCTPNLHAQQLEIPVPPGPQTDLLEAATVMIDGRTVVRVRGIAPYPAEDRAKRIRQAIIRIAENNGIDATAGRLARRDARVEILFGDSTVMTLHQADADLEQVELDVLADATLFRVREVINLYRGMRSPAPLARSTAILAGITVAALVLWFLIVRLFALLTRFTEGRVKSSIDKIGEASHRIINSTQLWNWSGGLLRLLRNLAILAVILTWLNVALSLYPWTRPFATGVYHLVLDPLTAMGVGIVAALPDVAFIIILIYIVRFMLRAARTFFERVDRGWIRLKSFDREWAMPTYRIVRILVIAFSLVVAYPYIPGSRSDAFKGVSLFLGVIFSIGSSSFIANIIAGYSLTYRRAFRPGDLVRIGTLQGEVLETRVLSTRLRSLKNEEINIPNQQVLSDHIVNYSGLEDDGGPILHTRVGIGYDIPWRQVEAMLLMAAEKTEGISSEPAPFVLQPELGDFAVTYELNAYCDNAKDMYALYSSLHANIQDVFNEHEVQIMSPHYERDPETPKLVNPADAYKQPAIRSATDSSEPDGMTP